MAKKFEIIGNYLVVSDTVTSGEAINENASDITFKSSTDTLFITKKSNGAILGELDGYTVAEVVDPNGSAFSDFAAFKLWLRQNTGFNPQASAGDGGANGGWTFAEINSTPYTVTGWDTVFGVHNDSANMEIILPDIGADDVGKELKFWIEHNPANYKVLFKAYDTSLLINGVAASGAEVARGEVKSSYPSYLRLSVRAVESNQYYIEALDSVYNQLRYVVTFDATNDYSPFSYLQFSAIPASWNWRTQDWFAYMKIERPMTNDSDGQVLFGSNNFFISYRGNGTYFMTSGTSGYLQTLSPNTIIEAGEYILYQYKTSNDTFSAWVNGAKVLNATTSGVTPPSTAPTDMWFGSEEGQVTATSGYGYPLQQAKISVMGLGTGNLSDADAALFTSTQYNPQANITLAGGGSFLSQWSGGASQMNTDLGSVNLTAVGSNISFEEI